MRQQQSFFPFSGGVDLETPAIAMPPGRLISSSNYIGAPGGYRRINGTERFDGQDRPSDFVFYIGQFTDGSAAISAGDTVTGGTSGETATVVDVTLSSGSWAGGDAAGYIAVEGPSGDYTLGENLEVSATPKAILSAVFVLGDRHSSDEEMAFWITGTEARRALITKVPGSGSILGVVWIDGALHAFRNNAGGTAVEGYKSTAAGWVAHDYGNVISFTNASAAFTEGETITGGTSGATAVLRHAANLTDEAWASGLADGVFILETITGTFANGEVLTGGTSGSTATSASTAAAYALPAGGRYRFIRENFYGSTGTEKAYGVNGVGKAFDFDGDTIVEIPTGMDTDTPFLIAAHKKHLFLGFPKGSLQNSSLGTPRVFSAITGANEIGLGDELTNLVPNTADTLLVTTAGSIAYLTGASISTFAMNTLSQETGARANTAAWIGDVLYQDERGIRSISTSQRYGNFTVGTYTQLVQKELKKKRIAGVNPVEAIAFKTADTYMLFFDDGTALAVYIGRKNPEATFLSYPFVPTCFWVEEINGTERIFAGASDGYVYELESGPSFDGEALTAYMQFPFAHQGGPRVMKRYHKAMFELDSPLGTQVSIITQFDYGNGLQPFAQEEVFDILSGSGGSYDIENWSEFYWDSPLVGRAEAYIQGVGENMSVTVVSSSAVMNSHTFQGVTLAYSVRGQFR